MKINLPVFKDEDMKDTVTYQSWCWDIMVYHQARCWDCTLLPYVICSLQGYPGELGRRLGTNSTLDGVIAILDEHYNNVKALDALNQELFQLWMGKKELVSEWWVCLSRHLQILVASFLECFLSEYVVKLKQDHFYGGLPKWFKAMVAYLKASSNEKMYSDYLQVVWEAEKEEAMEPSHNQTTASTSKPKVMSFFPLQKLKGSQPAMTPSPWVAHLEEEGTGKEECAADKDLNGIEGVTEEFIVHLARAVKDTQQEEKHCYHCSRLDHFIHDCLQVMASRTDLHLNQKEGTMQKKGTWAPQRKATMPKGPQDGTPKV